MRGTRPAAALGLALTLVCLFTAPAAAAPRLEEPPRPRILALQHLADHLTDLFGGWIRSVFAPTDVSGDPHG